MNESKASKITVHQAIEIAVSLAIVFAVLVWCSRILMPFLSIIVTGAVLAIAIHKPFLRFQRLLGGRKKLAVALFCLCGISLVLVPAWMFAGSIIDTVIDLKEGNIVVDPPAESVQDWPLIGNKAFSLWTEASEGLTDFLKEHKEEARNLLNSSLSRAASAGIGIIQFILSVLIAALFLSNADACDRTLRRLAVRVSKLEGERVIDISISTIRSVAVGILGTALIQSALAGIGLFVAGVPAAGVWVLLVLIVAIAQLPPIIVLIPSIMYVSSEHSTIVTVVFVVWCLMVSFSDTVLKPILLGRGVEIPMPVILLGAIGGMISMGIIGLFVGAVVLAMGYTMLLLWLAQGDSEENPLADSGPD